MAEPAKQQNKTESNASSTGVASARLQKLISILGPLIALLLVIGFFTIADNIVNDEPQFLTEGNLRRMTAQTATVAVAALGMTLVIIAGGIDLSVGTALALCAVVLAWSLEADLAMRVVYGDNVATVTRKINNLESDRRTLTRKIEREQEKANGQQEFITRWQTERDALPEQIVQLQAKQARLEAATATVTPWTPLIAVTLCLLTGVLCGCLNGVLISSLKVVPFIVTLGTMTCYLGVATILANETTVRPDKTTQVPVWLQGFISSREDAALLGLPVGVWFALLLALLLSIVLRYSVFGRYVFAIGSNEATARLCGINVPKYKVLIYSLAGLFTGLAGMYQFSRLSVGNPSSGPGMELDVIAAVVIGGGSLSGGRGSVLGTLTGATIIAVINAGGTQLGLSNPIQQIILGVIIISAVAIDQYRQSRLEK